MARRSRIPPIARVLSVAWLGLLSSCSAILGFEEAQDEQGCVLNSDCEIGRVCIFRACSAPCVEDIDCASGFRCLKTASGNACVDSAKAGCDQTCPEGTACASDRTCRATCTVEGDCLGHQKCSESVCVGTDPTHDPSLDAAPVFEGGRDGGVASDGRAVDVGTDTSGESLLDALPQREGGDASTDRGVTTDVNVQPDVSSTTDGGTVSDGAIDRADVDMGAPVLAIDHQPSFDFNQVLTAQVSPPVTFTVSNSGTAASGTLSAATLDQAAFRISRDDCVGQRLAPRTSCTVLVTMMSVTAGTFNGTISLGASPGGTVSTGLRGTVVTPGALAISPPSLTFADSVDAGSVVTQIFTVRNTGDVATSALEAPSLMGSASFTISSQNCSGATLGPAGAASSTCSITVRFAPTSFGTQSATLRDAATMGGLATAGVVGTGRQTFTLVVTQGGGGSVMSTPVGDIACGSMCSRSYIVTSTAPTVSLAPAPSAGFSFARWGGDCTGSTSCSVQMNANHAVGATFAAPLQIAINAAGSATGSVSSTAPTVLTCSSGTCARAFDYNTAVTLAATPAGNAIFNGWGGDCSGTTGCSLTMNQPHSVTAAFVSPCVAQPSATHYVDHTNGTNDVEHGGGAGACAYKTLSFALSQATGPISLVMGDTFQNGVAGEASPFTLTGSQSLVCHGAAFTTPADQSITSGMLNIQGTHNSITGCTIVGAGTNVGGSGDCTIVKSSGAGVGAAGHSITQNNYARCDTAIDVLAGVTNVTISLNTIGTMAAFGNNGVVFENGNGGSLTSNQMYNFFDDVICPQSSGGSPNVDGSGNTRNGTSVACFMCTHCANF